VAIENKIEIKNGTIHNMDGEASIEDKMYGM